MADIDAAFPKELGYGYRRDDTLRVAGEALEVEYWNGEDLVYRIRAGKGTELREFVNGEEIARTEHEDLQAAFLHHALAVYGRGLPAQETRQLSRLPGGSYAMVFAPGWDVGPQALYYPGGPLRRILLPVGEDPGRVVDRLLSLGLPKGCILEIPGATLTQTGRDSVRTSAPAPMVHALVFARELVRVLRGLASLGLAGPAVRRRPILIYAQLGQWPGNLSFGGGEGDPDRRYVFGFPEGLRAAFLERLGPGPGRLRTPEDTQEDAESQKALRSRRDSSSKPPTG